MNLAKQSAANILFFIVGLERVSEKPQEGDLGQFLKSIWDNGDSEHPVLTPTSQQAAPRSPLQGTPCCIQVNTCDSRSWCNRKPEGVFK